MLEKDHPELSLRVQANLLGLSYASLFYKRVLPLPRELAIKRRIDELYTAHPYYGSRKIAVILHPELGVSRPTVQAYMREMGIFAIVPGPNTSKPAPPHQIYPYLLRNVIAERPNHIWGIDITYIRLAHGWLYLTAVLDWYSRYILSWARRSRYCTAASHTRNLEQRPGQSLHQSQVFGASAKHKHQDQYGWPRARPRPHLHRTIMAHPPIRRSLSA